MSKNQRFDDCFLIYSKEDNSLICEIVNELSQKENIYLDMSIDYSDVSICENQIENAKLVLIFVSENSRKDSICNQLVKYTHDINKSVVLIGFHKGGIFNNQSWVSSEWDLRVSPFAWLDLDSRADFTAQLRDWLGKIQYPGDRVGAHISFSNQTDVQNYGNATLVVKKLDGDNADDISYKLDYMDNSTVDLRLSQGKYSFAVISNKYKNRVYFEDGFKLKHNSDHKAFNVDLGPKTEEYKEYALKCQQTAKDDLNRLNKLINELRSKIENWNYKKNAIESSSIIWKWSTDLLFGLSCLFGLFVALIYVFIPYCYDFSFGEKLKYLSAAITTLGYPVLLLFNCPILSWELWVTMFVISIVIGTIVNNTNHEDELFTNIFTSFFCIGVCVIGLKVVDYCLYDFFTIYGQRRLVVGIFIGIGLVHLIYWFFQVMVLIILKCFVGYRMDYCDFRKKPMEDNQSYLINIRHILCELKKLDVEQLNECKDDRILWDKVDLPLTEYCKSPKYGLQFSLFPLKRLLTACLLISIVLFVVCQLSLLTIKAYQDYVEKLLNFSIDLL